MLNINSKIKCKHVFLKHPPKPPSKGESIKHTANLILLVQPLINLITKITFKRLINLIKNQAASGYHPALVNLLYGECPILIPLSLRVFVI